MSNQFKPGDLAIIIGSSKGESPNIGKAIHILQKLKVDEVFRLPDGRTATNRGPECWMVEGENLLIALLSGSWENLGGIALVEERHLMPLRGDFAPAQQKAKEVAA